MSRYDFLVVGGGPSGCRTGAMLARAGHQVAILEKNPSVGEPICCTGIISCDCLKKFSIPSELVLQELRSATVILPSGNRLHLERKEVQAVVIDRGAYNAFMAHQAQEAGADYLLGHRVSDVRINPDEVTATVEHGGKERFFEARAVVLAGGFSSRLPQKLGLGMAPVRVAGAQVEVESCDLSEVEVYAGRKIAPGFFAWLVPAGSHSALAGLMTTENADKRLSDFLSLLESMGKIKPSLQKPIYRGITLTGPARTYAARLLLVGDAAGQVKPLTGGGIYFGLLCADIAAEVLHSAIEDADFSASRLSSYQREWRCLLGRELRLGSWGRWLYGKLSDGHLEWLVGLAQKRGIAASLSQSPLIGFDWHANAMLQIIKELSWPFSKIKRQRVSDNTIEVRTDG